MTKDEAVRALFDEYRLEEFIEVFRDDAKADTAWCLAHPQALSSEHPRVVKFKEICQILRTVDAADSRGPQ